MTRTVVSLRTSYGIVVLQTGAMAAASTVSQPTLIRGTGTGDNDQLEITISSVAVGATRHIVLCSDGVTVAELPAATGTYRVNLELIYPDGTPSSFSVKVEADVAGQRAVPTYFSVSEQEWEIENVPQLMVLGTLQPGTALSYVPPTYNLAPDTVTMYLQRDQGTSTWTDVGLSSSNTTVPNFVGNALRIRASAVRGVETDESFSAATAAIAAAPVQPATLTADQITVGASYFVNGEANLWFKSDFTIADIPTDADVQWSTYTAATPIPDGQWNDCVKLGANSDGDGVWRPEMTAVASRYPTGTTTNNPRLDFSCHRATDVSRQNVALRWKTDTGATYSEGTPFRLVVPVPIVAPPVNLTLPSISGASENVGVQLNGNVGVWSGSPTFTQNWQRSLVDLPGVATINYTPLAADEGSRLRLRVVATNAGGSTTAFSAETNPIEAELDPPPQDVSEWRQVVDRLQAERNTSPDVPTLFTTSWFGGEGLQWHHGFGRGVSDPNRVVIIGDMNGVRQSVSGGTFWYAPPCNGGHFIGGESILVDPQDPNIVYALANSYFDNIDAKDGVWKSTDGCLSWTLVNNIPKSQAFNRYAKKLITRWPVETGSASSCSIRVVSMIGINGAGDTGPTRQAAAQLWTSPDAGTTWTSKGTLAVATYGLIAQLFQHPTQVSTLFLCTEKGLWRTTDWSAATPTWTRPWGTFGATVRVSRIWIDPDDVNRMIVGCNGTDAEQGIWYTTNGGSIWTRALNVNAGNFAMGCKDPNNSNRRRIYVPNKAGIRPKITTVAASGGSPFGVFAEPVFVNLTGVSQAEYVNLGHNKPNQPMGGFCEFLPHATDPDEVLFYGTGHFFRSGDGGASFRDSNSGLCGANHRDITFDPDSANWGLVYTGTADVSHQVYSDTARVSTSYVLTTADSIIDLAGNNDFHSGRGVVVLPNAAPVPAGSRGDIFACIGKNSTEMAVYRKNAGAAGSEWTNVYNDIGHYVRIDYGRQAPNKMWFGRRRSTDCFESNNAALGGNYTFGAVSLTDDTIVYGYDRAVTGRIGRSTDSGATFSTYYTTNTAIDGEHPWLWLDPDDHNKVYTAERINGVDDVCLLKGASSPTKISMGLRAMQPFNPSIYEVREVAVDPADPRNVYVALRCHGNPWLWRGRWDSGYTTVTWTDITRNLPKTNQQQTLRISPHTGDVFAGTPNGLFVLPPVDRTAFTNSIYDAMPAAFPNGWQSLSPPPPPPLPLRDRRLLRRHPRLPHHRLLRPLLRL